MLRRSSRIKKKPVSFNEESFKKNEKEKKKNLQISDKRNISKIHNSFHNTKYELEKCDEDIENENLHNNFQYQIEKSGFFTYCFECENNIVDKQGQELDLGYCPCGCYTSECQWVRDIKSVSSRLGGDRMVGKCPICQDEDIQLECNWDWTWEN